jgi:hypothetical protein
MGPLSWMQEFVLERELTRGAYLPVWTVFEVPADITDDELASRLGAVVASQDMLRAADFTPGDAGQVYCQPDIKLPLRHLECADLSELRSVLAGNDQTFTRDGGPLWQLTVCHLGDGHRFAYLVLDHLIADALSMQGIADVLTGALALDTMRQGGSYWDWVHWQRAEFPREDNRRIAPSRDFWLRHLDGTMPDRPAPLPFAASDADARPGQVTTLTTDLPVSSEELRAGAGRLHATPFLVVFAGVVSWVARKADCYDTTVRVLDSGRRRPYNHTVGCLADAFPMRICDKSADDPARSLDVGRRILGEIMPAKGLTPWHYLRRVCASDERGASRGQLMISVQPGGPNVLADEPGERVSPGHVDELQVVLTQNARGSCRLAVSLSNEDFSTAGGRELVESLSGLLTRAVRTGRLAWR